MERKSKKIKVCHIISGDLWAGAESQVYQLVTNLSKNPSFEIYFIILNEGILFDKINKTGIQAHFIDEKNKNFLEIYKEAKNFLNPNNISILHSHRYKETILASLLKVNLKIPILIKTTHGIKENYSFIKKFKKFLYNFIDHAFSILFVDKIICVSNEIKNKQNKIYSEKKLETIHNCVEVANLQERTLKNKNNKEIIIGCIGRLVPIKRISLFIQAAVLINKEIPETKFLIVGDGPERKKLENLVSKLDAKDYVYFTGFQNDPISLLREFDLYILSSIHEGIPTVVLEAMALEVPVVATNVGGLPEIIENNLSGLLVEPNNKDKIAKSSVKIIKSEELRDKIIKNALDNVKRNFDAKDTQAKKTSDLYQALVESH